MNQNKDYANSPEAIQEANGDTPLISKIKVGTKHFNITSPKDWSENRQAHRAYIYGRTHYEAPETSFTAKDIEDQNLICEHSFNNIYTEERNILTQDTWKPTINWFTPDKSYEVSFKCNENTRTFTWDLSESSYSFTCSNQSLTLTYDSKFNTISLSGEDTVADGSSYKSCSNTLQLKPVAIDSLTPGADRSKAQYTILKKLDNKYIAIDNKTIRQNAAGVLQTDEFFDTDFRISQDFGKYKAQDLIPAKGKTLTQIIKEAFCEELQPSILYLPWIGYNVTGISDSAAKELTYEYGDTPELNWNLDFNPGKYAYGTWNNNDSNLYATSISFLAEDGSYHSSNTSNTISQRDSNVGTQRLQGQFSITLPAAPTEGQYSQYTSIGKSKIAIVCRLEAEDKAVSSFGEPKDTNILDKYANAAEPLLKADAGEIFAAYRWFWGWKTATEGDFNFDSITRASFNNSSLDGLPTELVTTKAKQWFFAVPQAAKIDKITLTNKYSGSIIGLAKNPQNINLVDASGTQNIGYTLFYLENSVADLATNTYVINISYGGAAE